METMTLSHLADLIIVAGFFGIIGSVAGHIIGKGICWVLDKIHAWCEKRREEKTDGDEVEQ